MKLKAVSGIMLTMLLISVLTLALNVQPVRASGTIYIRPDGAVDPPDAPIQQVGDVYTLTGDIYDSIVVERDNIEIDGAHYLVQGPGVLDGEGISLYGRSDVTIKNTEIRGFYYGIWLGISSNIIISGNRITNNSICGIYLGVSSNNRIYGNNIKANIRWEGYAHPMGHGIWIDWDANHNKIMGNNITDNEIGVELYRSSNNTISGNSITNNLYGIRLVSSSNNVLRSNSIAKNHYNFWLWGEIVSYFLNDVDVSNTVDGKPIYYWINKRDFTVPFNAGYVALVNCSRVTVENLSLARGGQGVVLAFTTNSRITNNKIINNAHGIWLRNASNNRICRNNVTENTHLGINLWYSFNNSVYENHITNNDYVGIDIESSSNNSIYRNNILANRGDGVYASYSSNNSIYGNSLIENGNVGIRYWLSFNNSIYGNYMARNWGGGIHFERSSNNSVYGNHIAISYFYSPGGGIQLEWSSNNSIYHNNFVDHEVQVSTHNSTNVWDAGYPSGGNYWSDYLGNDTLSGPDQDQPGSDGIGDTPYIVDTKNQDNYPFIELVPIQFEIKPIAVLSAYPKTAFVDEQVEFDASASYDLDGSVVSYMYGYGDGFDSGWISESVHYRSYPELGEYYAKVKVKDSDGLESDWSNEVRITVLSKPVEIAEWTFMVYLDGDNDLEEEALRNVNNMEEVGSTPDVNVIALIDRHPSHDSSDGNWTTTRLYKIEKDMSEDKSKISSELLEKWGEQNMGSAETLSHFIAAVKEQYPAKRYALVLMDHGGGWQGFSVDLTNDHDTLNMTELRKALADAGVTLDVLVFEACLMSMIEVAYQIKSHAKIMVGSEDLIRYLDLPKPLFWHIPYDEILNDLKVKPEMNGRELAEAFVQKFKLGHRTDPLATLSAIDLSQIDNLSYAMDELSQLLLDNLDTYKMEIRDARGQVKEYFKREEDFPFEKQEYWNFVDLQHFAELIKQKISDENIKSSADAVIQGIENAIIDEWHHLLHSNTHGISIYFPDFKTEFLRNILDYAELEFSVLHWNDFLWEYLDQTYAVVFVGSKTIDQELLEGIAAQVDGEVYRTTVHTDLVKGEHTFLSPSRWIDWSSLKVFVFDHWEELIDDELITVSTEAQFTCDIQDEKTFIAIYRPFTSGTTITLHESDGRLFVHVYDDQQRHIGLNYEQNQSEIAINEACYFDNSNGTIIIALPPEVLTFIILVDAKYADRPVESYNLTIVRMIDSQTLDQKILQSTIDKNGIQEYVAMISSDGIIDLRRDLKVPWWQLHWHALVFLSAASVFSVSFVLLRRRKRKRARISSRVI